MRKAGVQADLFSMPGEFGIGGINQDAEDFVSLISGYGFTVWNTLPVNISGKDNSPFTGISFYAGNPVYINPYDMYSRGLINGTDLELAKYRGSIYTADYDFASKSIYGLIEKALDNVSPVLAEEIAAFSAANRHWLTDYARCMILSSDADGNFSAFPDKLRRRDPQALELFDEINARKMAHYRLEQYLFYSAWARLKKFANDIGVKIVATVRLGLPYFNAEVWCNPDLFELDKDGLPLKVLKDGCGAGNSPLSVPVYIPERLQADKYSLLRRRFRHLYTLYDGLIIDDAYNLFELNCSSPDGRCEKFRPDGKKLINLIKKDNPGKILILEKRKKANAGTVYAYDIGGLHTENFQNAFAEPSDAGAYPHNYDADCVAFTSRYDTNTALGWLYELEPSVRDEVLEYVGFSGPGWGAGGRDCTSVKAIARQLMASACSIAVIPVQDLCGFGDLTRVNSNNPEGDWKFRLCYDALNNIDFPYYSGLIKLYKRNER